MTWRAISGRPYAAVEHGSPTLNATMLFHPKAGPHPASNPFARTVLAHTPHVAVVGVSVKPLAVIPTSPTSCLS